MTVSAAEKSRPYYLLSDTPQHNHSGCHYSLQWVKNFFLKTDSGNISLTKTVKVKLFSWKKKQKKKTAFVPVKWNGYGFWLGGLVWQNFVHCLSASPTSGKQHVSNWSAQQSIHQRVHWDEEINVSALPRLFHLCQRALIQAWKAINWTYPKGIAHTRYWYLKGCLGAKKRPL